MAGDGAVRLEHFQQLGVVQVVAEVLDVDVGEALGLLAELLLPLLARHELADEHLLVVEQHAVHLLDGVGGRLLRLEVDEPVALGDAVLVGGHAAAHDVAEGRERVVHGLVVDRLVQRLDEDVADTGAA